MFSKEQIYDVVWKEPYSGDYNIVMSHIREKIEDDPSHLVYIQTVWGVGYRFNKFRQWSVIDHCLFSKIIQDMYNWAPVQVPLSSHVPPAKLGEYVFPEYVP